jgi:DNA-binding MarR family transcriptional regulator
MIDEQFASTLEEHGVTRRQWQLLSELSQGPASVEQLDAAVAPFLSADDHESSVEHLTELIDSGWVDATAVGYEITDRGRIAADRLAAVVDAQRALATEGVTAEQYEGTVAVLEKVARNLGWNG